MRECDWRSRSGAVLTVVAVCAFAISLSLLSPRFSPNSLRSVRHTLPSPPSQFTSLAIDRFQPRQDSRVVASVAAKPLRTRAPIAPRKADTASEALAVVVPDAPPSVDARIELSIESPERNVPLDTPAFAHPLVLSDGIYFGGTGLRMGTPVSSVLGRDQRRVPRSMRTMYVALGGLEAADVQLTLSALNGGAREANPLLGSAVSHPAALVGMKAASVLGTIYLVERLRKRHPVAAAVTMAAIDAGFVGVVVHNSRVASSAQGPR